MATFWTDEKVELAIKLRREGYSGTQIQRAIGAATRNVVIGKMARMGVAGLGSSPGRPKTVSSRQTHATIRNFKVGAGAPLPPTVAPLKWEPGPEGGVPFEDLRTDQCRWPLGGLMDKPELFCGADRDASCPYCSHHRSIAYNKRIRTHGAMILVDRRSA